MTDTSTPQLTVDGLLISAKGHLAAASTTTSHQSRHHSRIAHRYACCASLLISDPLAASDLNEVVVLLHQAQTHGPYDFGQDEIDYLNLAWIRLDMAEVAHRGRLSLKES
jgi:hypothetical protein